MISYRQADLLPQVQRLNEVGGHIMLGVVESRVSLINIQVDSKDHRAHVRKLIYKILSDVGFDDSENENYTDEIPYYYLESSMTLRQLTEEIVRQLNTKGFEAGWQLIGPGTRMYIRFKYFPNAIKTADLLPRIQQLKHKYEGPVLISDLRKPFDVGTTVKYIPGHAHNNKNHPDCQIGKVTSWNNSYIFVNFGKGETSEACEPRDLIWF